VIIFFPSARPVRQEISVTYVRHGETLANATGRYSARTMDAFSPKGQAEVAVLTRDLESEPKFDEILVSPAPRTLRTIAPYLKATGQRATVWPLLYECCTGHRPAGAHATRFLVAGTVQIPKDLVGLFRLIPGQNRFPNSPSYNAGLAQVGAAVSQFRQQFQALRVLIVGHSGMGGQFLHTLTGRWIKLDNARPVSFTLPR
jgi:probable phosphoglycerate mutase